MKSFAITSILILPLMFPVKSGAQAQPVATAPQAQPAATAPQAQPVPQARPATLPLQPASVEAQPQTQAQQPFGTPPAVETSHARPARKSPATALMGTLVGTGLGIGMLVGGLARDQGEVSVIGLATLVVAPSFGYIYTGETGRAVAHMGVRAGAVGLLFMGATVAVFDGLGCHLESAETCEPSTAGRVIAASGLVIGAGSIAYSIYDAPRSARRHNARHRQLMLVPTPMTGPDHSSGLGLQLGGSF